MTGTPTLVAAFALGLAASAHCVVMCGGIASALGVATARDARGGPRASLLAGYQLGRIASYALAGLAFGGVAGGFIARLDDPAVRVGLRATTAATMLVAALFAFGVLRDPGARLGRLMWPRIAPVARRLLPVTTLPRAFAFGTLWGWMPCGFVYTMLLVATASFDAWHAAATMAAFGFGTMPALLASAFGVAHLSRWINIHTARRAAGAILVAGAVLTLAGPWLAARHAPWLHALLPYDCAPAQSMR
ncbi:sulfite exporter TauE/SafE family protein [Tahibacter soli]|uniref:Sulfite exporter TauE/SafE family protein n=1 Tax=Tahibacter soli TaxID=2983605 RepID=A0A9X3YKY6_9GAMM|nr:sulfite exporter TauE/SafE family protein [Tahibacter soli]MDC8012603.1 sulfite exporter TauE/SafE family protein [Tahibacter soli]